MPKSSNQKLKLLYILDYLKSESDENHPISTKKLINHLDQHNISAERKSIYTDIDCLRDYGCEIEQIQGKNGGYYLINNDFQLPELKLLVDAVQSSKFITVKKSNTLIKNIEKLASRHEASQLNRQIYVANRVKTMNESIYYNVDNLHKAMNNNHQISFKYFEWTVDKEKKYRHDGKTYKVSPWSLCWDDENYYLVSYDSEAGIIKHFRVDKMERIFELENTVRDGKEHFDQFDQGEYSKQVFGMFAGISEMVTIKCENRFAGVIIDRFGHDILLRKVDADHFECAIKVTVSPPFLSWVFQFAGGITVVSPDSVKDKLKEMANATLNTL